MDAVAQFFAKPFKPDGSAIDWFLFFGLLIAISVIWRIVLAHTLAEG